MAKGATDGMNPYDMAAGAHSGAGDIYAGLAEGGPGQFYDDYMNPYTNDVINATTDNMMRNNDLLLDQNATAAIQGGAFGGSRHGVVDAVTNAETTRSIGDMEANLRNTGYNTAMGNSFDHFNAMGGLAGDAVNYGNNMFNVGNELTQQQAQAGNTANAVNQGIMDAAAQIFGGNDPMAWLTQIQGALSGNPLMGESTTTSTNNPGSLETIGAITGTVGDVVGK